jgi:hypothetical protein
MRRRDLRVVNVSPIDNESAVVDEIEEEEDPSAVAHRLSNTNHGDDVGDRSSPSFIEVQWDVVYSKTYRIPQLLFTVSDCSKPALQTQPTFLLPTQTLASMYG